MRHGSILVKLGRSLRIKTSVGFGTVTAALAIAVPFAAADPAPVWLAHTQTAPRPGEGLSGADRSWLSPQHATPRLGEGLTGADRRWLASTPSERLVASPTNGFNWGDAGIGAATTAAAILVLGGSVVAIRRRVSPAQ